MPIRRAIVAAASTVSVLASSSLAQISYQSENRYVDNSDVTVSANGFGVFDVLLADPVIGDLSPAVPKVYQNSVLGTDSMSALLSSEVSYGFDSQLGEFLARGHSHFEVAFDLSNPTPFSLSLEAMERMDLVNYGSSYSYSFTGPSLNLVSSGGTYTPEGVFGFLEDTSGILQPGTYTFIIEIVGENAVGTVVPPQDFEFNFSIPTPASASLCLFGGLAAVSRRRR